MSLYAYENLNSRLLGTENQLWLQLLIMEKTKPGEIATLKLMFWVLDGLSLLGVMVLMSHHFSSYRIIGDCEAFQFFHLLACFGQSCIKIIDTYS